MKLIKIAIISVLSLVLSFLMVVIYLSSIHFHDLRQQQKHMITLRSSYTSSSFQAIDESIFYNFELTDTIKLNDIQFLASHNSYKKKGSSIGHFFVGLGSSRAEAKAMNYSNHTLSNQLKLGIRSFELDIRLRKDQFNLTHVPLVDNSSVAPDLRLALEEFKLFSIHHPNHFPITILLEIKDDWMILDPSLQTIQQQELVMLNELIKNQLGDHLYSPHHLLTDELTLKEHIETHGWPSVTSLLGKIMVILHAGSFIEPYVMIDESLSDLAMFPSVYAHQTENHYTSFIIENNPFDERIFDMVSNHFIVRTRLDSDLIIDLQRREAALLSGAQLLTSDFTVSRTDLKPHQRFFFENDKTIRLRP